MRHAVLALCLLLPAVPAAAQPEVGSRPADSPYRDLRYGHGLTLMAMRFSGNGGKADVGPGNGTLIGARYDLRVSNPVSLGFGIMTGTPERVLIDPDLAPAERESGPIEERITLADVALQFTLTGAKSWHRLAPYLGAATGIAFGPKDDDVGGYKFGLKLYLAPILGTRFSLSDRLSLRAEGRATFWKLSYPQSYREDYVPPGGTPEDGSAVLPGGTESEWVLSPSLSLGLGYSFRW